MNELLTNWLGRNGFLPHGYCITWSPGLLWSMVGSDAVIAASYFSIPLVLMRFSAKRPDVQFGWLLTLFSVFIFACGTTHVLEVWTIWQPDYAIQGVVKLVTAAASLLTAVVLWPLFPRLLDVPSAAQFRAVIASLEAEVRQRRTVEEQLVDTQQSLAVTLASIGAGFIATDAAGNVTRLNQVAARLLGWPEDEAIGKSVWVVFDREERPAWMLERNPVDVLADRGSSLDVPAHLTAIARDGRRVALEVKADLTRGPEGAIRGLAMVFRDLTAAMRADADARRLAAIVESTSDAVIGKTLDGRVTTWNAAAQRLFGYAAEDIVGESDRCLIPPNREQEERELMQALADGKRIPPFDTALRAWDGRRVEVSLTVSPVRDAQGRIVGASKIIRDVSAQRQAEQAHLAARLLEAENRQVQEASRLKSQFLANMSHELRTPMNAIIGFADLLHGDKVPVDSPKRTAFLDHIRTSGRHLLQLINDILDLSKIESGKLAFHPEPLALGAVIGEVVDVLHEQAARRSIAVAVEIAPAVERPVVDAQRLKQVLYNFLSNALKFTRDGGRVGVRARPEPGTSFWRLEVEDNGIGIDQADLGRLFVEFQQLDDGSGKAHAGTGLGLALTRRLVEAQGGSVGVVSSKGVGSVFHALLPLDARDPASVAAGVGQRGGEGGSSAAAPTGHRELPGSPAQRRAEPDAADVAERRAGTAAAASVAGRADPGAAPRAERPSEPATSAATAATAATASRRADEPASATDPVDPRGEPVAPAVPGRTVLVIEDDPEDQRAIAAALSEAGFAVAIAGSAAEALALTRTRTFWAVTLDMLLPDRPGFEVLEQIRAEGPNREVPVLVVTMINRAETLAGLTAAFPVADVLTKPIDASSLLKALRRRGVVAREDNVVMIVDDDRQSRALMRSALATAGFASIAYADAAESLAALESLRPAAVILDLAMPGMSGFEFLERLRADPMQRNLSVYIWTSRDLTPVDYERLRGAAQGVMLKGSLDMDVLLGHLRASEPSYD